MRRLIGYRLYVGPCALRLIMDARVKPGHDERQAGRKQEEVVDQATCAQTFRARISDSHFKQPARKESQSSAAPVLARRGERRDFHPLADEGESSLTKGEG